MDTCKIYVYAREEDGSVPTSGTLKVTRLYSPDNSGSGDEAITVVLGENSAAMNDEGYAEINVIQGAVVDLELTTDGRKIPIVKRRVVVPSAESANWETLETSV